MACLAKSCRSSASFRNCPLCLFLLYSLIASQKDNKKSEMTLFENQFLIFSELNSDFFNFSKISLHLDLVIREKLCTSHPFLRWFITVKGGLNQK